MVTLPANVPHEIIMAAIRHRVEQPKLLELRNLHVALKLAQMGVANRAKR
jgi:hypothetical protein